MKMKVLKFYRRIDHNQDEIFPILWEENVDYKDFRRKNFNDGFKQICISTEMMAEFYSISKQALKCSLCELDFQDSYEDLKQDIEKAINGGDDNFVKEKITEWRDDNVEFKKMRFKGRQNNSTFIDFYIQSNGIVGVNEESFDFVKQQLTSSLKEMLF